MGKDAAKATRGGQHVIHALTVVPVTFSYIFPGKLLYNFPNKKRIFEATICELDCQIAVVVKLTFPFVAQLLVSFH